ncbi:MAG: carbohydrate kinase family protein [Alphaproteobacteria bacterium]|jgi:pseudouridine kinase|nr:carbohydrate kinase family protein [Alphaproteobacteria bacterium]
MTQPEILAVGGAHIDRRGQVSGAFVPGASNPGIMREEVGGGAFNALRNAVQRGAAGAILSMRGGDTAGDAVARAIAEAGISDLSAVFLDRATPSYTALLDKHGDVVAALADMALYDLAFPKQMRRSKVREAVDAADALLCDANLPATALEKLVPLAAGKPVFAIAISPAKAVRLTGVLPLLTGLFMNPREAAALAGTQTGGADAMVGRLRDAGLAAGVVTQGPGPVLGFDPKGIVAIEPPAPRTIADVTGAGDALAGATIAAMLRGLELAEALREGMAAAMLAIETPASVPKLPADAFAAALALVPQPVEMR